MTIDKTELLNKVLEMIDQQHTRMDGIIISPELKAKSEGFIEALYQIESLVINFGVVNENRD
jgi:hypothetical protein